MPPKIQLFSGFAVVVAVLRDVSWFVRIVVVVYWCCMLAGHLRSRSRCGGELKVQLKKCDTLKDW